METKRCLLHFIDECIHTQFLNLVRSLSHVSSTDRIHHTTKGSNPFKSMEILKRKIIIIIIKILN